MKPSQMAVVHPEGVERVSVLAGEGCAINGAFFHADGSPASALKLDGVWVGDNEKPRATIGWWEGGVVMDRLYAVAGDLLPLSTEFEEWDACRWVVGGAGLLVWDGEVVESWEEEQMIDRFVYEGHHRTALGLVGDQLIAVVVDERITLAEMAQLMWELGCHVAINLDGGGSSAMVLDGVLMTEPSDWTGERAVGSAIIFSYTIPDGS
jgi:Phosphodiester glycosidase